ncbi:MAG: cellulase family glycosylhydrolase, partial [Porcipelethomonas sp.]
DKDGNEVWLTGANWFGFNCTENCAHGLYAADIDNFLSNISDHGINIVRMPISTELLVSWMNGAPDAVKSVTASYEPPEDVVGEDGTITKAGTYGNINKDLVYSDGKTLKNSMEIFDVIMQKMKKYGLKVMVDVHSPASHNSGHNYNLWYYDASAADADNMAVGAYSGEEITWDMWKDSITWLAEKYSNDDTIIGYDLKNEPHGKREYSSSCPANIAKWDNSEDLNNWAYSATECANSVLSVNPNALIFIEGVEQYPKTEKGYTYDTPDIWGASADASPWYGAWWGGNLRGVKDYPITPDSGTSQIVYSPHDYGPSVFNQTWFDKDFTTQTLLDDYWYDTWAYINDQDIAPLLIGEWGGHMDGGKNEKWMTLLRDYMIENHISHTFWGLNPNSGDTGGLLGYDFATWDDEKYGMFEISLWQTQETGKYIGLDHKTALGSNGISLSDFYDSYAYEEGSNIDGGTILDGDKPEKPTDPTEDVTENPTDSTEKPTEAPTTEKPTESASNTDPSETIDVSNAFFGDVDCNDKIEIADVVTLNKYLLDETTFISEQGLINANCEFDELINMADSSKIINYLAKIITEDQLGK